MKAHVCRHKGIWYRIGSIGITYKFDFRDVFWREMNGFDASILHRELMAAGKVRVA